jgi:D-alanine-D-alanine ligase
LSGGAAGSLNRMDRADTHSRKPRVAVVFGGRSSEHAISCVTAGSVLAAIDRERYDVVPIGITTEGRWVLAEDAPEKLAISGDRLPSVDETGTSVILAGDPTLTELTVHEPAKVPQAFGSVDVVLPLLHGPYGEDGTLQGLLELAGVPYVGSGVLSSAASMDKEYMKVVLAAAGLPVGAHVVVRPRDWETNRDAVREAIAALGYPVFVKPARGGSSIGITKVSDAHGVDDAIGTARQHDPKVVVEAYVEAREIECGVLQAKTPGPPDVSVVAEIVVQGEHEFYDFEAKYLDGATRLDVPADIPENSAAQIRQFAARAFEALSCEGLARVDFFLRRDGSVLVNEVNTMPGFTPTSMFPLVWAASGVDYPALVDRLLRSALQRPLGLR